METQGEEPKPAAPPLKKPAPTLYVIIGTKFLKGLLFVTLAITAYTLSDNDLPKEYQGLLHHLRLNPERKFFADVARQIGHLTETNMKWAAAGTLFYSLFSLVEGVGLILRLRWVGWVAIGDSVFFIPIECYELVHNFSWAVVAVLALNVLIVWYLFANRERLFRHHH